jgi:ferredoxin, 2Fe-2S
MSTIRIRFIHADQTEETIDTATGQSLMKAAVDANVHGIEADCGGVLTCATCHVMIDSPWADKLTRPVADETDMLDFAASPVEAGSRLSCQIRLTPELDGLVVRLPASQH